MAYTPTTWQNSPATTTPINATNLNKMETGIDQAHDHIDNASVHFTAEQIRDLIATFIVAGANVTVTHNDAGDTLTIAATGLGGSGAASDISYNTAGGLNILPADDTVQEAVGRLDFVLSAVNTLAQSHQTDITDVHIASAITTSGHNGNLNGATNVQAALDILDNVSFVGGVTREEIEDLLGSSFVAGAGITVTYSDVANTFTITNTSPNQNLYSGSEKFGIEGAVTVRTGKQRIYNDSGRTRTILSVRASVDTAPTGASLICDVNKGGTTIFGTQASRPTIAASTNTNKTTGMTVNTWEDGTYLSVDVDQIGSSAAGADLTVLIEWS